MGYMGARYGDYMGGYRGDPGFFSKLLKIGGKIVGSFLGLGGTAPAPTYAAPPPPPVYRPAGMSFGGPRGLVIGAPARGAGLLPAQRPVPRQVTPGMAGPRLDPRTGLPMKRKRMNPANPKALRRAIRRQSGFVKLARRALKGSGYQIVSRGSRKPSLRIQESGSGGVTVQK